MIIISVLAATSTPPGSRHSSMIILRRFISPLSAFSDSICVLLHLNSCSSLCTTATKSRWDPAASLTLKHPTLLLLENKCRTHHHFKQILAQMIRIHLTAQTFPMSRLLYFSAVSHPEHLLDYAILLFQYFTPKPNLFIFNTMISALSLSLTQSLTLYKLMLSSRIGGNEHSLLSLLKFCACLSVGKQIHTHVVVSGYNWHAYLQNSLIKMYMACAKLDFAYHVFERMPLRDTISYNIMISGYVKQGCIFEAFLLCHDMLHSGVDLDEYTMVGLLQSCGQLKDALLGKSVHGCVLRRRLLSMSCLVLSNVLMDMYAKCGEMRSALKVFERLGSKDGISWNIMISGFANAGELDIACRYFSGAPMRDLVSWNTLLAGFAQQGDWGATRNLFEKILAHKVKLDKVTIIIMVSAASELGVLNQGRSLHGWAVKAHGNSDSFLGSALIDMYCKCGSMERSLRIFELIKNKDITTWTAMITGLAIHGHGTKALEIFGKLLEGGIVPNSVTLIAVLTACSHSGLVDEGVRIFSNMKQKYGFDPGVEHYGCLVDLLARSGRLTEAEDLIRRMPVKPSKSMWGAILSASKAQNDIKLAKEAVEKLAQLDPDEDGGYVLLSNVYASCERWSYSDNVRETMESRGIKKTTGWSILAIDGVLHVFVSSDTRHPSWGNISSALCELHKKMALSAENLGSSCQI